MSVEAQIKEILEREFTPVHLEIKNDSDKHAGHAGHDGSGESHFRVTIVSPAFEGQGRIARQRAVYKALENLMNSRIHALSLKIFCPQEYVLR